MNLLFAGFYFMQKKFNSLKSINKLIPKDSFLKAIELIEGFRETPSERRRVVLCQCKCGNKPTIIISLLVSGKSKSCGCRKYKKPSFTNGHYTHLLYSVWDGMKGRCYNTNYKYYNDYGGKGVVICEEWKNDFNIFFEWAINNGWEKGLALDKDIKAKEMGVPPLLYSPERCQFVTQLVNNQCRRNTVYVEYKNKVLRTGEWALITGLPEYVIRYRHLNGWSSGRIFTTPVKTFKRKSL